MAKAHGLHEVFVEVQGSGYGAAYLGDLQGMGEAGDIVIAEGGDEDLGLVLKPAEGLGMNDSVAVALEVGAQGAGFLFDLAASGKSRLDGKGREGFLAFFEIGADLSVVHQNKQSRAGKRLAKEGSGLRENDST